jgi:hypothetical protein
MLEFEPDATFAEFERIEVGNEVAELGLSSNAGSRHKGPTSGPSILWRLRNVQAAQF